jgi:hypothetical protein
VEEREQPQPTGWTPNSSAAPKSTIHTSWISNTPTACEESSRALSRHSATPTRKFARSQNQRKFAGPFMIQ